MSKSCGYSMPAKNFWLRRKAELLKRNSILIWASKRIKSPLTARIAGQHKEIPRSGRVLDARRFQACVSGDKGAGVCPGFHRHLRGNNSPVNSNREKAIPARRASVGGQSQEPEQPGKRAGSVLARNAGQVQIAAHFAVHIADIGDGCGPGIKAQITRPAAPRAQPCEPHPVVFETSSA